jgi:hypothetical protein
MHVYLVKRVSSEKVPRPMELGSTRASAEYKEKAQ